MAAMMPVTLFHRESRQLTVLQPLDQSKQMNCSLSRVNLSVPIIIIILSVSLTVMGQRQEIQESESQAPSDDDFEPIRVADQQKFIVEYGEIINACIDHSFLELTSRSLASVNKGTWPVDKIVSRWIFLHYIDLSQIPHTTVAERTIKAALLDRVRTFLCTY
jgi:hypothetical protein